MITVTLKEAYALVLKKEVKQLNGKQKQKLLRTIEENFGAYEITGKGKATRITFDFQEEKEVVVTRKKRVEREENEMKILHFLCENYWIVDFYTNELLSHELNISESTLKRIISSFRKDGTLAPKLEKVETSFYNHRSEDWDTYLRDVNENTYFYKHFGTPILVTHDVWKKYWQWQSDWIDYYYEGDFGAHEDRDVKKDSRSEFRRLNGFEIIKKHTRKPNEEVMKRLGYEITPCPFEIKEDVEFASFVKDDVVEVIETTTAQETVIPQLITPSNIGFGKVSKIKSFVLPIEPLYEQSIVA